jgi:hypothetical protein
VAAVPVVEALEVAALRQLEEQLAHQQEVAALRQLEEQLAPQQEDVQLEAPPPGAEEVVEVEAIRMARYLRVQHLPPTTP